MKIKKSSSKTCITSYPYARGVDHNSVIWRLLGGRGDKTFQSYTARLTTGLGQLNVVIAIGGARLLLLTWVCFYFLHDLETSRECKYAGWSKKTVSQNRFYSNKLCNEQVIIPQLLHPSFTFNLMLIWRGFLSSVINRCLISSCCLYIWPEDLKSCQCGIWILISWGRFT